MGVRAWGGRGERKKLHGKNENRRDEVKLFTYKGNRQTWFVVLLLVLVLI